MDRREQTTGIGKTVAVIPSAGAGIRMGAGRAKQFLDLGGSPLLAVTLGPFQHCPAVDGIILVVPFDDVEYCRREIVEGFALTKVVRVVPGGKRRQDSVRLGIEAAGDECAKVLIHDGVRPFVDEELLQRVIQAAGVHRAVVAGLPARETVKEVGPEGDVAKTYERSRVRMIQTPQVFQRQDILRAHRRALEEGWEEATDDSALVERLGIRVRVVEGSERNIKVTTPHDLDMARFLITSNQ